MGSVLAKAFGSPPGPTLFLWVVGARERRGLPFPTSSEAGKAMPRPGRGFQGGRMT